MLILFNAHPASVNHASGGIRAGDRRYYIHFQKVTNHFHPLSHLLQWPRSPRVFGEFQTKQSRWFSL